MSQSRLDLFILLNFFYIYFPEIFTEIDFMCDTK